MHQYAAVEMDKVYVKRTATVSKWARALFVGVGRGARRKGRRR